MPVEYSQHYMTAENISQVLAPDNAPFINENRLNATMSKVLLKNFFQGLIEGERKGVTTDFTTSNEVKNNAQIFVRRILPIRQSPRELGAIKNGGSFNNIAEFTKSTSVGIDLLDVIDKVIIIPRATRDMINVNVLSENVETYLGQVDEIINGGTAAAHLEAVFKAKPEEQNITLLEDGKFLQGFTASSGKLLKGDREHGIGSYDIRYSIAVFKMEMYPTIFAQGGVLIGGSNYAQEIIASGGVSRGADLTNVLRNGYVGNILGIDVHLMDENSLSFASTYLGLPQTELSLSPFMGYIANALGTGRGVDVSEQTKVVDTRGGQGIELQPYTRYGVETWYPKSVALMMTEAYNPYNEIKEIFSDAGTLEKVTLKKKGEGSRLYATANVTVKSATTFVVDAHAYDQNEVIGTTATDYAVAGYYVVADTALASVHDFYKAVKAGGAVKGKVTKLDGTTTTTVTTLTAGKVVNVLVISTDGSLTLASGAFAG